MNILRQNKDLKFFQQVQYQFDLESLQHIIDLLMGSIQSKIKQSYSLTQKPYLKKKTQKSISPSCDFHEINHIYRKNSAVQNGAVAELEKHFQSTSFTQFPSNQYSDPFSTDTCLITQSNHFPASAIGLVKSIIDQQVHYGVGSLIGSNIVLTTAHQLYSMAYKNQANSIKFLLNNGSSQQQFDVEKLFIPQSYTNWDQHSQELSEKIFLEDYGIIVLKSHANIAKYGLLGFDFSQRIKEKDSQIWLYGFNHRKDSLRMESICLKAQLTQQSIKYKTLYNFTINGGPIISQQNGNYIIIGIQNPANRVHNLLQHKSLRLSEKIFNEIGHAFTIQEQEIDLRDKSLGKEGLKKLVKLQKNQLSHINISRNKIGVDGLKYLTRCEWKNLHHLDIGGNEIKKEGVMHLIKIPMKNLLCLNMWGNQICSQGALMLLQADWKHLTNINLYNNSICNEGMKSLIKAKWEQLQSINLGKNCINGTIIPSFQYAVWKNILSLNVWGNTIKNCKATQAQLKRHFPNIKYIFL